MHTTLVKYMQHHALTLKAVIQLLLCGNSLAILDSSVRLRATIMYCTGSHYYHAVSCPLSHDPCHMTQVQGVGLLGAG